MEDSVINTSTIQSRSDWDNSNSGAVFAESSDDMLGPILSGVWRDAREAQFGLCLGPDIEGERTIVQTHIGEDGEQHPIPGRSGTVKAVVPRGKRPSPAYKGNLGNQAIVLWAMNGFYQIKLDTKPKPRVSAETLALLGMEPE